MYDVTTKIGILRNVINRALTTLLPIIEECVLPSTEIFSDCWAAYIGDALPIIPLYVHKTVNHRNYFVDPVTEVYTNNVENFWKNAKAKNKAMSGTTADMLPSYLNNFM